MEKKIVFITGSNRGIGKAIADKFAANGCTVIRNGVSKTNPDDNEPYIQADIGTRAGVSKIKRFIKEHYAA